MNATRSATLAALCMMATTHALAQDSYPSKPITVVIPAKIVTSEDLHARGLTVTLSKVLSQKVSFENLGGEGGVLAADTVAKAAPDGYTLLFGNSATQAVRFAMSKRSPYDPRESFTPIALAVEDRLALLVAQKSPIKNVPDLLAACKQPGAKITYGLFQGQDFGELPSQVLNSVCGGSWTPTGYEALPYALKALENGDVTVVFVTLRAALATVKTRPMRLVGVADELPVSGYDDSISLPKFVKGLTLTNWQGLFGPAKLPDAVVQALSAKTAAHFKSAINAEAAANTMQIGGDASELARLVARDQKKADELMELYKIDKR